MQQQLRFQQQPWLVCLRLFRLSLHQSRQSRQQLMQPVRLALLGWQQQHQRPPQTPNPQQQRRY